MSDPSLSSIRRPTWAWWPSWKSCPVFPCRPFSSCRLSACSTASPWTSPSSIKTTCGAACGRSSSPTWPGPCSTWSTYRSSATTSVSSNLTPFSASYGTAWPCIIFTSWSSSCGSTSSCPCGGRSCASWIKHRGCRLLFSSSPTWPSTSIPVISGRSIPTIPSSRTLSTSV